MIHLRYCDYSPSLTDLSAGQFFIGYAKYLGPAWFRKFLAEIVPSESIQRIRKASIDIEAESQRILADKRAGLKSGDKSIMTEFSEKKDIMSILG